MASNPNFEDICNNIVAPDCSISSSSSSTVSSTTSTECSAIEIPKKPCPGKIKVCPPNIQHELNVAKSILKECSTFSGDNAFDHLSEIIRKIIDQRPPNVIDYFEEFSKNIREKKNYTDEPFIEKIVEEPRTLLQAEKILTFLGLYGLPKETKNQPCEEEEEGEISPRIPSKQYIRPILANENILQIQLFWKLCGLGFQFDEIYQLSYAMMKLIYHPVTESCRFWGKLFGRYKSYYIVEVELTAAELARRFEKMSFEQQEKLFEKSCDYDKNFEDPNQNTDLIPGHYWRKISCPEDLERMKPDAVGIPLSKFVPEIETELEMIGTGLNRRCYFVITSLTDDWTELPIVTPQEVVVSKKIKKLLTGYLDNEIFSYPTFPGLEKNYLRAIIARITSGTYIAPRCLYKIRTKKDLGTADNEEEEMEEEEEEEEENEEEQELMNINSKKVQKERDYPLILNPKFVPMPNKDLTSICQWVHIRPSILNQGRVVYFNKIKEEGTEDEGEEEKEEEEEVEEEFNSKDKNKLPPEAFGPPILSKCEDDISEDLLSPWSSRLSSAQNDMNQIVIMRSNLWPGSYNIATGRFCDNIYLGWGQKYLSRNYSPPHLPFVEWEYCIDEEIQEVLDPTVQMEEAWRLAHLPKETLDQSEGEEELDEEDEDE